LERKHVFKIRITRRKSERGVILDAGAVAGVAVAVVVVSSVLSVSSAAAVSVSVSAVYLAVVGVSVLPPPYH
jgi:hypothetical protein